MLLEVVEDTFHFPGFKTENSFTLAQKLHEELLNEIP